MSSRVEFEEVSPDFLSVRVRPVPKFYSNDDGKGIVQVVVVAVACEKCGGRGRVNRITGMCVS